MQLREMLSALRSECGLSTNVAHGLNDRASLVYLLDRVQLDLWEDYDWPFLQIDRLVPLASGQQFYAYPADINFEGLNDVVALGNNQLYRLHYGIGPEQRIVLPNDQPSWPPARWRHDPDTFQMEIWPVPDASAAGVVLNLHGTKSATRLVNDADEATLPWRIVVLTAAAELLAKQEDPSAQSKAARAAELIRRLKARTSSHKSGITPMGGQPSRMPRVGLDFIPTGYGQGPRRT
jgi:hypothetical protein